jgi:hypothetical protein
MRSTGHLKVAKSHDTRPVGRIRIIGSRLACRRYRAVGNRRLGPLSKQAPLSVVGLIDVSTLLGNNHLVASLKQHMEFVVRWGPSDV